MTDFDTKRLPAVSDHIAPDGSNVRVLLTLKGCVMGHYELGPGQVSIAVTNQTVEELWYVLSGNGEMWRKQEGREEIIPLESSVCLSIPLGTHFQFRSFGDQALTAVGITTPPWPGPGEAIVVSGKWEPTVKA